MPKIIENVTQKVLNAAQEIYRKEGFDAISIRRVAKQSGLAVGTVYNHFEDKHDLLTQVLANDIEHVRMMMMEIVFQKEPENALRDLIFALVKSMISESGNIIQYMLELQSKDTLAEQILHGAAQQVKELVEELLCRVYCKYNKQLSGEESSYLADLTLGMLRSAAHTAQGSADFRAQMICDLLFSYANITVSQEETQLHNAENGQEEEAGQADV